MSRTYKATCYSAFRIPATRKGKKVSPQERDELLYDKMEQCEVDGLLKDDYLRRLDIGNIAVFKPYLKRAEIAVLSRRNLVSYLVSLRYTSVSSMSTDDIIIRYGDIACSDPVDEAEPSLFTKMVTKQLEASKLRDQLPMKKSKPRKAKTIEEPLPESSETVPEVVPESSETVPEVVPGTSETTPDI